MDSYYEGHWDIKPSIYRGIFVCLRAAASIKSTQAGTNKGDGVYNNKISTKETKINSIFFITARSLITSLHRGSWEGLKLGSTDNTAWIWKMMWDSSWRIPGQSNANYCGCRLWQRRLYAAAPAAHRHINEFGRYTCAHWQQQAVLQCFICYIYIQIYWRLLCFVCVILCPDANKGGRILSGNVERKRLIVVYHLNAKSRNCVMSFLESWQITLLVVCRRPRDFF